jgi:uncharacterized membrane protein
MKTVHFINHDHPAAKAAQITSDAMRRAYAEARAKQTRRETQAARRKALSALAKIESVHAYVSATLATTPDAWYTREVR